MGEINWSEFKYQSEKTEFNETKIKLIHAPSGIEMEGQTSIQQPSVAILRTKLANQILNKIK